MENKETEQNIVKEPEPREKQQKDKNIWLEIIRFVLTGGICTLIDFFCTFAMMRWILPSLAQSHEYIAWAIATLFGFVVSTIVNFILSRVFVFKNTNVNTKTFGYFMFYAGLSVVGFLIGLGIQELGVFIVQATTSIAIGYDITKVSFVELFQEGGLSFWLFAIIFVIKTLIVLVWNYLSRKFFIFRAPKIEEKA